MKVGVVGYGVVGGATGEVLGKAHEILPYDKFKAGDWVPVDKIGETADVIFICVPTPMRPSGEIDLTAVEDSVFAVLDKAMTRPVPPVLVIRSTSVSGTTRRLSDLYQPVPFAFNPEFLTERNAVEDFRNSDRIVVGTEDDRAWDLLKQMYEEAGFKCPIIRVGLETAEMVKYAGNCFLATKAVFANELYRICEALGVDYQKVKELVSLDPRIGPSHLSVPGPDGDFGMGGKCFPKDLNALIERAKEAGYDAYLLREVWRTNLRWRTKKDW